MSFITNVELLDEAIKASCKPPTVLAAEWGVSLPTYYSRKKGESDFTATEIVAATRSLNLTKAQRDAIFFGENCE